MLGVRLFPPQVLSDLNFFNVSSKEELALRLRAVQRVAAAAIGTYLMVRYVAKLGSSFAANVGVRLAFSAGYACLSFPTANLVFSVRAGYLATTRAVSSIRNKEIGWAVADVVFVGMAYFTSQVYRDSAFEIGPNFLERFFQKVEDKLTESLYRRFYTQTT